MLSKQFSSVVCMNSDTRFWQLKIVFVYACARVYIHWKNDELKLMTLLLELRFPGRLITACYC